MPTFSFLVEIHFKIAYFNEILLSIYLNIQENINNTKIVENIFHILIKTYKFGIISYKRSKNSDIHKNCKFNLEFIDNIDIK